MVEIGDFVSDSLAGVGDVGGIDEISAEKEDERKAKNFLGPKLEVVEEFYEHGIEKIDHNKPTDAEHRDATNTDTAVEVEKLLAIIPPFEMFEGFEIPAGEVFENATANQGGKKNHNGVFFEATKQ